MIRTLRLQLTVWYLASFAGLLLLFSLLLYGMLARSLERRLGEGLTSGAATAAALMAEELEEMHGDGPAAAADVLGDLPHQTGAIAILDASGILALTDPARKEEFARIPRADRVQKLPRWGRYGALAASRSLVYENRNYAVLLVEPLDAVARDLAALREAFALAIPLMLALAGVGGYLLTRRGLAPLGSIVEQTRKITSENLDTRLQIGHAAEELTTLAASFNELLSRLDQSFESMRRFVQDASHELRTPLAVIRGEADVALSQERGAGEYRDSLAIIQEESRRLSRLVDDLLNLARADAGHVQLQLEILYLNDLLADCCRSVQPLAAARQIELHCSSGEDVAFRGDEELLRRMVINLLDNAIRYTPPGGKVTASLEAQGPDVRIRVTDTGVGIAPEATARVFERFYRADKARSRQQGGFGLGLSIVKWIAESHRGAVELVSHPGTGSTFTVRLQR
jgi:two-component system, OmpR family, sensor kinase